MRLTTVLVVAFAISVAAASFVATTRDEFEAFKRKYNKHYSSTVEEQKRLGIFQKNMIRAAELSKANPQARFGDSPYADMTPEEFKVYHNADKHYAARVEELKREGGSANYHPQFPQDVVSRVQASSIDWRAKGAVTHVKNQGQCGSCWAFSTTGGIEGQWFLAGNTLTSLSEQELVSCDTIDSGCNGGLMNSAMDWLLSAKQGAIVTEASYPYVSGGGNAPACQKDKGTKGATIKGHFNVYHSEEQMLAWMSTNGPLSLAVDATAWQLYSGGIMTNCGGTSLDHGVLIVGYTATGNTPYWIFKNSWGASWGEEGYIYIKYGDNQCLLTHYPVSSIVKGDGPAPTPLPNSGYVTYEVFDDAGCVKGNQSFVFATSTCVSWDGESWEAQCSGSSIEFTLYAKSLTCTGESRKVTKSVGQCGDDQADFLYYKYGCNTGSAPTQENSLRAKSHFANTMKRSAGKH